MYDLGKGQGVYVALYDRPPKLLLVSRVDQKHLGKCPNRTHT